MSIFEHSRWHIFNSSQHPLVHDISDFGYINDALPGVSTLQEVLDYIVAVLYPNAKPAVNTVADLPLVDNEVNDYRIVLDDGDGKAAGYRWEKRQGELDFSWWKIYDFDWSTDSIVSQFLLKTQDQYVYKHGYDDIDKDGDFIVGLYAGQTIYGGASANTNLTLRANAGDGTSLPTTGYVQVADNFRPSLNDTFLLGTDTERFKEGYFSQSVEIDTIVVEGASITDSTGQISFGDTDIITLGDVSCETLDSTTTKAGNLTLTSGSISDTSGVISFGSDNLNTTGTFASGITTIATTLLLNTGSITDTTGSISFGTTNLLTTGTLGAGVITGTSLNIDNINLDGNAISVLNEDGNLIIQANGTGVVDIQNAMTTINQTVTGVLTVTGQANVDNLRLDTNTISSVDENGNITLSPHGSGLVEFGKGIYPTTTGVQDLGKAGNNWKDLFIHGRLTDGTLEFLVSELMKLRNVAFRDAARTSPAQAGDALFYDTVSGTWLADHPDTEITHGSISGLTTGDAGHTQFAMLSGRAGGQTLQGGTAATDNLILESTAHATKGNIFVKESLLPHTTAIYDGSWSGLDLGSSAYSFRHFYMKGEGKGLRLENFTTATLPDSSASSVGRIVYSTNEQKIYVDTGAAFIPIGGANKFVADISFDGIETEKNIDVSSEIEDARNAQIQLLDNSNDFEQLYCKILRTSASNVRILTGVPLPAGSYRLIVIE